jgi:hypothetical protein
MNVQFTKSGCKLKSVLVCRWYTPDPEQSRTRHQLPLLLKWVPETPAYRSRNQNTAGLFQFAQQLRGEFRPRQTRQLPRAVDLKGRLLSCQSY